MLLKATASLLCLTVILRCGTWLTRRCCSKTAKALATTWWVCFGPDGKGCRRGFTTTDDRLDRTYRLGAADMREELNKSLAGIASQISDTDTRLAEILPVAAADIFPDWTLGRDLPKSGFREPPRMQAFWRGTERPGSLVFPNDFFRQEQTNQVRLPDCLRDLPAVLEPFLAGAACRNRAAGDQPSRELDWLFCTKPLGLSPEAQAALKP